MAYETSYESGRSPFKPDLARGRWEHPRDFLYACFGLALKMDILSSSYWIMFEMGISGILPYYIYMVIYLVPLMVIHSYMGQFSSSGFISAFRLSPFFKGIGYVSLAVSMSTLTYYAIFAAVPIIFIVNSLRPTLPWSCEGIKYWEKQPNANETICNASMHSYDLNNSGLIETMESRTLHVPAVLFFMQELEGVTMNFMDQKDYVFLWRLLGIVALVWAIVAFIFHRFSETAQMGKFLRYMIWSILVLLILCFLRFLILPHSMSGLTHDDFLSTDDLRNSFFISPVFALQAFGAGWGSIMALSSFNNFKTNIMNYSWIVASGQMLIYILFGLVSFLLHHHFHFSTEDFSTYVDDYSLLFVSGASVLATLEWPNLWTILYYTMLLLSALIVIVTQVFTIVTSLFDEFEFLRHHKREVTFGLIGVLAMSSIFFCSNHGVVYYSALTMDSLFTQTVMHLLLLLMIVWVYGRQRFQRDIEFMTGQLFASWKVVVLRFIAPLILLFTMTSCFFVAYMEHAFSSSIVGLISILIVLVPLVSIPAYGIYITSQATGNFRERLKRACQPTDWYPLEREDREQYENTLGTNDITHQLYEVTEELN